MPPRPDVSAERKPQIVQAAMQVFLKKGFSATRMEDIAGKAGLSVGNIYRYFPGKLDITLALMKLFMEPSLQISRDLLTAPGTSRQRLEGSFLRVLAKQDHTMLALYSEMYHLARHEPQVYALLQEYNLRYQEIVAAILQQGIERFELRSTCDPEKLAFAFQSIFDGFMQNFAFSTHHDLPSVLAQTFDMLFEGLSIPQPGKV